MDGKADGETQGRDDPDSDEALDLEAQQVEETQRNHGAGMQDAPGGLLPHPSGWSRRELTLVALQFAAVVAIAIGLIVLSTHDAELFDRVLGLVLVLGLGFTMAGHFQGPDRNWGLGLASAVGAVAGVGLMINPNRWLGGITLLAGAGLALAGVVSAVRSKYSSGRTKDELAQAGLLFVAGGALILLPDSVVTLVIVALACLVVTQVLISAGVRLRLTALAADEGQGVLLRWLATRGATAERRRLVYEQTFFEGRFAMARTGRYCLMMFFASVISAVGVMTDSTAVVVGAMLIAPLISPMMGMGLSLAMGWPNRLSRSTLHVAAGIAIAIGTGWILAAALRLNVDVLANSQITSRASPTITDLVVAVAAGAAGAFALSRSDVSSALPGVAIAIALVPPLSVAGVTAQGGNWVQTRGSLLLFLTNLIAILFVGGAVFIFTGIAPLRRVTQSQHRVRTWGGVLATLSVLVIGALVLNGEQIARDSLATGQARSTVIDWLGVDPDFAVVSLEVEEGDVTVTLTGPGDPPSAASLADRLASELDRKVRLDLQWVPRNRAVVTGG